MQPIRLHLLILFCSTVVVAGCGTFGGGEENEEVPAGPTLAPMQLPVGKVHMVRTEGDFVLIQSSRHLQLEPGKEIRTFDSEGAQTATLEVSPARKGRFLTADVVRGEPNEGDQAVMNYEPALPEQGASGGDATGRETQVLE